MPSYIIVHKYQVNLIGLCEEGEYTISEGSSFINPEYGTPEYDEALLKAIKLAQSFII